MTIPGIKASAVLSVFPGVGSETEPCTTLLNDMPKNVHEAVYHASAAWPSKATRMVAGMRNVNLCVDGSGVNSPELAQCTYSSISHQDPLPDVHSSFGKLAVKQLVTFIASNCLSHRRYEI